MLGRIQSQVYIVTLQDNYITELGGFNIWWFSQVSLAFGCFCDSQENLVTGGPHKYISWHYEMSFYRKCQKCIISYLVKRSL